VRPSVLLPVLLPIVATACAPKNTGEVATLMSEVQALQARVDELETFRQRVEMVVELPGDPEQELAALELAYKARDLMLAGEGEAAKDILQQIIRDYPETQVAAPAMEMLRELQIIGSDAGPLDVKSWVRGKHTMDPDALTVVVFFEAWCPHCQREVPVMEKAFQELDEQGLDVVGITNFSRGTTEEQMTEFLDTAGVTFPVGRDDGTLSQRFAANGVPHAAVLRHGKVEWIGHPGELDEARLKEWLAE